MAKFDQSDDSVVVIIGSGAGGGTLANELCQKGIKVVVLEAGALQSQSSFINDEWKSFGQLAWLDPRTTSGTWRIAKDFAGLDRVLDPDWCSLSRDVGKHASRDQPFESQHAVRNGIGAPKIVQQPPIEPRVGNQTLQAGKHVDTKHKERR